VREGETGLDAAGSTLLFGAMLDEELADELDEEETSACAPYLARQMSCLVARTPGVRIPPFRFGTGRKGG